MKCWWRFGLAVTSWDNGEISVVVYSMLSKVRSEMVDHYHLSIESNHPDHFSRNRHSEYR